MVACVVIVGWLLFVWWRVGVRSCTWVNPFRVVVNQWWLRVSVWVSSEVRSNSMGACACDPYHSGSGILCVVVVS